MEKLHFFCSKIPENLKRIQEMVLEGEMLEWRGEGSVKETEGAEPSSSSLWCWGTWAPLPLHETPVAVQQGKCSQAVLLIFTFGCMIKHFQEHGHDLATPWLWGAKSTSFSSKDSGFGVSASGRKASFCSSHTTFQRGDAPRGISSTHVHFFS